MIISESCLTPRFLVGLNDLITSTLSCPFTLSNIKAFPDKHSFQELDKTRPSYAWYVGPFYWTRVTTDQGDLGDEVDQSGQGDKDYHVVLGCIGLYWAALHCTELWWAVADYTGLY